MKITAIEPQKRHQERVNVHVDGAFRLALALEIVLAAPLRVGDEMTDDRLRALEEQDLLWKAREAAYNLLSFRPRTAVELRRRLLRKEFPPAVADACVSGLVEKGLVSDADFAELFVRDRVRLRPKGRRMLVQELRAKGVDADTAEEVVADVWEAEDVSDVDLAREAAAKWSPRRGEDPRKARGRLYAFLGRRGFGGDTIRQVADEFLAPADEA